MTVTVLIIALFSQLSDRAQAESSSGRLVASQVPSTEVTDRIVTALIDALKDSDRDVRRNAVQALSGFDSPLILAPVTALLKHEDVELRKAAADVLARRGDERAVPALMAALGDTDAEVRAYAARALGTLGDARAVDPLRAALNDQNATVRRTAVRALATIAFAKGRRRVPDVATSRPAVLSFEPAQLDKIFEVRDRLFKPVDLPHVDDRLFEVHKLFDFDKAFDFGHKR